MESSLELRLIESSNDNLTILSFIHKIISDFDEEFTTEQLHYALKQGKIILMLDGFDEISFSKRKEFEKELLSISRVYPEAPMVVSSRSDECFASWEEFHIYEALPLNKAQAVDLISRQPISTTIK